MRDTSASAVSYAEARGRECPNTVSAESLQPALRRVAKKWVTVEIKVPHCSEASDLSLFITATYNVSSHTNVCYVYSKIACYLYSNNTQAQLRPGKLSDTNDPGQSFI